MDPITGRPSSETYGRLFFDPPALSTMVSLGGFFASVQQSRKNIVDGMEKAFHIVGVIQTLP